MDGGDGGDALYRILLNMRNQKIISYAANRQGLHSTMLGHMAGPSRPIWTGKSRLDWSLKSEGNRKVRTGGGKYSGYLGAGALQKTFYDGKIKLRAGRPEYSALRASRRCGEWKLARRVAHEESGGEGGIRTPVTLLG